MGTLYSAEQRTRTPLSGNRILVELLAALVVVVVVLLPRSVPGATAFHVNIGYSSSAFLDVSKEQGQAVSALWASLIARNWGGTAETVICSTLAEFQQGIRADKLDLVVLLATEYLALRDKVPLEPLFISARDGNVNERLILAVRKDSGYRSVADLRGKTLLQQKGLYEEGRNLWLDTLLMRRGIAATERFFLSDRATLKPSAAIMPVFFGKADACVITKRSFEVMSELNPQLKDTLSVIAESPEHPISIIAVRKEIKSDDKKLIREVLGTLHQTTQGMQLLTLFRMKRLVPYRDSYLAPTERMFKEYHDLKQRTARRR